MPSLKVWRRRWSLSSDDLLIPACIFIAVHFSCILCMLALFGLHIFAVSSDFSFDSPLTACSNLNESDILSTSIFSLSSVVCQSSYLALLSLCSATLLIAVSLEIAVAYYSSQGTIMIAGRRARLVPFLGFRYLFIVVEICYIVFAYVWSYGCPCSRLAVASTPILAIAITENVVVVLLVLIAACSYDSSGAEWYRLRKALGAAEAANTTRVPRPKNSSALIMAPNEPRERKKISHTKRRIIKARQAKEAYAKSWFKQFNVLFCCLGSERRAQQATFLEVASLVGELFGDTDLVVSDLIAGLILLRRAQKRVIRQSVTHRIRVLSGVPVTIACDDDDEEQHIEENPKRTSKAMLEPDFVEADAQLVAKMVRIFNFAYSATGWPFYVLRHPGFLVTAPLSSCHCISSSLHSNPNILHDNSCKMNTQAVLRQLCIEEADLIYADFQSGVGETAFLVVLDAQQKAVVVSIRGTMSMSDVLTDLNADSAKIPGVEEIIDSSKHGEEETQPSSPCSTDDKWLAHKGMLAAAIALRDRLVSDGLLARAFEQANKMYGGPGQNADFGLIFVGHSLGAGVAALIGLLLKPCYPDLHVFAFSPPGGLLGISAARFTQSFVTTVILGKDIIPRIGVRQIEAMRTDIVNVLKSCSQPKWNVIGQAVNCCSQPAHRLHITESEANIQIDYATIKTMRNSVGLLPEDDISDSVTDVDNTDNANKQQDLNEPFLTNEEILARNTKKNSPNRELGIHVHHHPLQLPGTIYHIVRQWKAADSSTKTAGRVELKIVKTCRSFYDHVLVSPRMLNDHMPNNILAAFEEIVKQHKIDVSSCCCSSSNNNTAKTSSTPPRIFFEGQPLRVSNC